MKPAKLEILAPAGSPACLQAAVRCGAAAVYLGVGHFNARRSAENFTIDSLTEAVAFCHANGVAVHLALNTLLWDRELPDALALAEKACEIGVDALIVQDVGLARRLKAAAPSLPLHASTQLSCHTPAGVRFLRDAGFSRVVLSREMTRDEIAACTRLGVETEVFVHGALCMCVSGQCYFSAMLGGRSGNRGACAQPCRLPFEATKSTPRPCPSDQAVLSLKDNCLISYVAELEKLGVTSLKIEGRMKRPEYVAEATALYRAAADGIPVTEQQIDRLRRLFSRSGFTDGYYTDRRGGAMFGVRRKEDVMASTEAVRESEVEVFSSFIPVDMDFFADETVARLTVTDDDGHTATAQGDGAVAATNRPLDPERARQQLQKTGGTAFIARHVTVAIGEGLTLPLSAINGLRRQALDSLWQSRSCTVPVVFDKTRLPASLPAIRQNKTAVYLRLSSVSQWSDALRPDGVFVPLSASEQDIRRLSARVPVGVEIPRGLFGAEESVRKKLAAVTLAGATMALCQNVGALPLAVEAGLSPVGGFGLNITNREAVQFYALHGLTAVTVSPELTFARIRDLSPSPIPMGAFLYGRLPLMLTRNCPRRCAVGSCNGCEHQGITDRTGTVFPVMCEGGCSEVLNSVPISWNDRLADVPLLDFHLLHFTTESAQQVADVWESYQNGTPLSTPVTRGLYKRGVE